MPTITTVDATWDTAVTMDASELRRADTTMFLGDGTNNGVRGGIAYHGPTSLGVTVNGSDQVTVQAGAAIIPAATGLGVYRTSLGAATSAIALSARNATNPRIDLVVIQVTGTAAVVKTIDGTPGASPVAPALPAQHIELARLTVPQVGGGAVTVDSTWRTFATAVGGRLLVPTSARLPASGNFLGQKAVTLDFGAEYEWTGSAWRGVNTTVGGASQAAFIPADGTVPAGRPIITYSGTVVLTTDTNGVITITYPSPFPNGVISVVVSPDNASGAAVARPVQSLSNTSGAAVVFNNQAGTAIVSTPVRVSYIATGW